ncbi:glycosyltransferase [Empedobacter tilapiae]|uniref:glycosyltransferase n=1 Tax=Empedobacter tilapiae TaxID=2491114 RepID=UPI0028D2B348|nr:glycosyltransferase [Empedobacter tilapiae]
MKHLTIIISTLNKGILGLEKTIKIQHPEICYLIVHQNYQNISVPDFLNREDIEIIDTPTKGLSESRNIGIKNCKTRYALIADDDLEYIESGLEEIVEIVKKNELDFATFKIQTLEGEPEYKNYPLQEYNFGEPKQWFSSVEILLNINSLKDNGISFDERFGLGTKLKKGEEEILINDCRKAGLQGKYFPIYIVIHPFESSGKSKNKELFNFFFHGSFDERLNKQRNIKFININNLRFLKTKVSYYLGQFYIKTTNYFYRQNH